MPEAHFSKPLVRGDDASKALIIEVLAGHNTYGFDIDSIYYFEAEAKWAVIEFLKCDHATVKPSTSHPSRYWSKNWRKFASLWRLTKSLNAELYLVNYEDEPHARAQGRVDREFCVINVIDVNPTEGGGILKEDSRVVNFAEFRAWFQALNARGAV